MRWIVCLVLVAQPALADDAQSLEQLLLGRGWAEQGDADEARRCFRAARGLAEHNYLKIEALARSAGLKHFNSAARASDVGLLMTYFRTTPPQWLSDEARKIVMETHAAQSATGLFEHLPAGPGMRATEFGEGRAASGFEGRRYHWIIDLPGLPPPRVLDSDVPERMAEIQTNDADRLGDPERRIHLGGDEWAIVDERHQDSPDRLAWRFDRCVLGYTLEPVYAEKDERGIAWWKPIAPWYNEMESVWQLRFRLFYASQQLGAARDYTTLAHGLLETLLRGNWVGRECLGREPLTPSGGHAVINVYLTENRADGWDAAGAERTADGIYLYQAATEREPDEWVREALHEYAHAALPQLGRFGEADAWEPWLEGPLGERLLLYYLAPILADQPRGELLELLEYVRTRKSFDAYRKTAWDPLVEQFLAAGPSAPARNSLGNDGAAWLLGLGCWIAETHEPALVRELWRGIHGRAQLTGSTFLRAYTLALREPRMFQLGTGRPARVDPDRPPRTVPRGLELRDGVWAEYLVFLPRGHWNVRVLSAAAGRVTLQVDGAQQWLTDSGDRLTTARPTYLEGTDSWRTVRLTGFGANATVLRGLHFVRE